MYENIEYFVITKYSMFIFLTNMKLKQKARK